MLRAFLRAAVADVRVHRLQSILLVVIVAVAAMTLTLAVNVNRSTAAPFDRLFDKTHGAHIWFETLFVMLRSLRQLAVARAKDRSMIRLTQ